MSPINFLAQLEIYRIEARVLSTIGAAILCGIAMIASFLFGADVGAWVYGAIFVGCGIVIIGAVLRALYLLIRGAPQMDGKQIRQMEWDSLVQRSQDGV
jgi:hypothetical protein